MCDINSGDNGYPIKKGTFGAYYQGEKPLSKWTKADMLEVVEEYIEDHDVSFTMATLKKAPKSVIADLVLSKSSLHYTSCYWNKTYYYYVSELLLNVLTDKNIIDAIKSK